MIQPKDVCSLLSEPTFHHKTNTQRTREQSPTPTQALSSTLTKTLSADTCTTSKIYSRPIRTHTGNHQRSDKFKLL